MNLSLALTSLSKSFLQPGGPLAVAIPDWPAIIGQTPFPPGSLLVSGARFDYGGGEPVTVAAVNGMAVSLGGAASASVSLMVVRPDDIERADLLQRLVETKLLPPQPLAEDQLYLVLFATTEAEATSSAGGAAGGIKVAGGLKAGGACEVLRALPYPAKAAAKTSLSDFIASLQWPTSANLARTPLPAHAVFGYAFAGQLRAGLKLEAGYAFAGAKGVELGDLATTFAYKVKAGAALSFDYTLGGSFRIAVTPGSAKHWMRLQISREHRVGRTLGLGLDLGLDYETSEWPENVDALIDGLLGVDVSSAVAQLETIAAAGSWNEALASLEAAYDRAVRQRIDALVAPALAEVFTSETFAAFRTKAKAISDGWRSIAEPTRNVLAVLEDPDKAGAALRQLLQRAQRGTLGKVTESELWLVLETLTGGDVASLFVDEDRLAALKERLRRSIDELTSPAVKSAVAFVAKMKSNPAAATVADVIAGAANPGDLGPKLTGRMAAMAGAVFDLAAGSLDKSAAATKALAQARKRAQQLLAVREKLSAGLAAARKASFQASIQATFARSSETGSLFDLEFNLNDPAGARLFDAALAGDCSGALRAADPGVVRLLGGAVRELHRRTSEITVSVLGRTLATATALEQLVEATLSHDDAGQVYVFKTDTSFAKSVRTGRGEAMTELKTRFAIAAAFRARENRTGPQVDAFDRLTTRYSLTRLDPVTTIDELRGYLGFATDLGLLPAGEGLEEYLRQLQAECPQGLGKVELDYRIAYDATALWNVFHEFATADIRQWASAAVRRYFAQCVSRVHKSRETIASYVQVVSMTPAPRMRGRAGRDKADKVDLVYADGRRRREPLLPLYSWWTEEQTFLGALQTFDEALASGDVGRINAATQQLCLVPKGQPVLGSRFWDENVFALAMDALLARQADSGRQTALVLTISPPGEARPFVRIFASEEA